MRPILVAIVIAAKRPYIARDINSMGNPPYRQGVTLNEINLEIPHRIELDTNPAIPHRYTITAL